jgi:exonuclease VII small subunit
LASTVYDIEEVELSNGDTLIIKPLPIKQLREFMKIIATMDDEDMSEDDAMDIFIEGAMHCLKTLKPELSQDKDKFEEIIEIPTMMKILEVAGGLKLTDPNLLGAVLVGTN